MKFYETFVNWYFSKKALPYWCVLALDCLICYLSAFIALRFFFKASALLGNVIPISQTMIVYIIFDMIGFKLFHTYYGVIRYSSFVDLIRMVKAMCLSMVLAFAFHYLVLFHVPGTGFMVPFHLRHLLVIYIVSTLLLCTWRVIVKRVYDSAYEIDNGKRTMIFGTHAGGVGLAKQVTNQKPQVFNVCGFIASEPKTSLHYLLGQKVFTVGDDLTRFIATEKISTVLVSPLQNKVFRDNVDLQNILIDAGVHIYMMGSMNEWDPEKGAQQFRNLKEVSIEDLLPRDEIKVNLDVVEREIRGKRILVTGSAGSIGSEIVRQVAQFHPEKMMLIDQAETPQHDVRLYMKKNFPELDAATVVTSITNESRMEKIFSSFRPDYVFHAAAYKHVPMMEDNPCESIRNNVWGTKILADLSVKYGVRKFVMISTDKAVNPTNVMGCSKRICEIYVQSLDRAERDGKVKGKTGFVTTRFGNVLGSNGSVIPLFKKQIAEGGPVTVTDPNIIRFFMLIPEACQLVLEAGTQGEGGEIFVFDMGKPVKIAELAKRMIMLSGATDVQIKYTGLRPGEKLYEEVLSNAENTIPSFHEKIKIAKVCEYDYAQVEKDIEDLYALSDTYDDMAVVKKMKEIVPEYTSPTSIYGVLDKKDNA